MSRFGRSLQKTFFDERADYEMSRESKLIRRRKGLAPQGGTADWHYRNEAYYYRDMEKARDMDRNDSIVGQTVERAVNNIVQDGFSLDVNTGDRFLDADLKARWRHWANNENECELSGEMNFHDIERFSMRSSLIDGDIVALGTNTGRLQMIEAHAIQTRTHHENTVLGVQLDSNRRRSKYYILQDSIDSHTNIKKDLPPVSVRDENGMRILFHVYNPKRVSQTRGVTAFAPIFATTGFFEDINFAKLVQQQVVSSFAILHQKDFHPDGTTGPVSVKNDGNSRFQASEGITVNAIKGIGPGLEMVAPPGSKIEGFSPNVPNAEFFNHVRLMLQIIGVNLGLPLCLVLMDGSETNFSGWRGAVDEARKGFKRNQNCLMRKLHQPVYRWKVQQWMDMDPALRMAAQRSGIDIFGHSFNAPAWQYIEPLKDAQGDAFQIQNALTSPRRNHGKRGQDWNDVTDEIIEDNATAIIKAKRQAIEINTTLNDGQPVHWRELISLPMPSGLKMDIKDPNSLGEESNV